MKIIISLFFLLLGSSNCFLSSTIKQSQATVVRHPNNDHHDRLVITGHHRNGAPHYSAVEIQEQSPSRNYKKEFMKLNAAELIKLAFIAIIGTIAGVSVPLFFSEVLLALQAPIFDLKNLLRPLSKMLICHIVEPIMTVFYVQKCTTLIDKFTSVLRMSVYSNILRRDVASFESNSPTSSTQLVIGEIDKIKSSAMSNISRDRGLRAGLELASGLCILYKLCFPLALFFSTIIPITAYCSSRFAIGLFSAAAKEGEASAKQASRAQETIANFKEVFSFSTQPLEEKRFAETQSSTSASVLNTGKAKAYFEAANRAGIYSNIILLFSVGGVLVSKKLVRPTVLVSFIGYCFSLNFATQGLLFSYGDVKTAEFSWSKISKFLKESIEKPPVVVQTPVIESKINIETIDNGIKIDSLESVHTMDIKLKDVSFSYSNRYIYIYTYTYICI
jgi:ABC-type multidrug transport system fused ATPase/permease subunit